MRRCVPWFASLLLAACPSPSSPPAPAPAVDAGDAWADATLPGDENEKVDFAPRLAVWDFAQVEEVARDTSGRRHHVRVPPTGFTRHSVFGRAWDGTQPPILLRDHPDFAPAGAFRIEARVMLGPQPDPPIATAHLIRRVGDRGRISWALDLIDGDTLRFTVGDAEGRLVSAEGKLEKPFSSGESIYANFDGETGELSLYAQCRELEKATTRIHAATALPGAHLELLSGIRGYVFDLGISRGVMLPDGPLDGQCAFTGSKMESPEQAAARPKPRPVGKERVAPAMGAGILRAAPGDFEVFDLHEWEADPFGADKLFEARGQLTLRRVEGDAPYVVEVDFRLAGQWREKPRADSYAHVVALEPMAKTVLYAYPPDTDFAEISFDPSTPARTKAGRKTFGGVAYDAEQVVNESGQWKRLVAEGVPALALSGGLLESANGKPKAGRGWLNRLAKTGKGSPTSALDTVWPPDRATTPYLVADDPMGDARRAAQSQAERLASSAAFKLGEAFEACAPIVHPERTITDEVLVVLQGGKLLTVESKGSTPDAKTLACLKEKAEALALSPRISQLAVRWQHEGPKTEWQVSRDRTNDAIARVHVYGCAAQLALIDGLVKGKKPARLVIESSALTAFTVGSAPAPDALVDCVKGKLDQTPVVSDERLEISVPFSKK